MSHNSAQETRHIVNVLRRHAAEAFDRPAFTFLVQGERPAKSLSYGALEKRARTIAAVLAQHAKPQARALLIYPSGLDFIEALWGCFYARLIAVPAYTPHNNAHRTARLNVIMSDCAPELILCKREDIEEIEKMLAGSGQIPKIVTNEIPEDNDSDWYPDSIPAEDIALLQYSSGSTSSPRGVMVSHANILANQLIVKEAFRHTATSTFVGWLPFFHDMGLFGQIIQPLFLGTHSVLMSPTAFIQKPVRWLKAISQYRGHTSGGPNFAYEYCVRKIAEEEKNDLDLSCWKRAFNGAEKPRPETMKRFSDAFARCGFSEEMFYPCYGLAESVLFVTGRDLVRTPQIAQTAPLRTGSEEPLAKAITHASSGRSWSGHQVIIVDPEARTLCDDGNIGEIWISGPSIAKGYWDKPLLTDSTFNAFLADSSQGPFLRTGDLGFISNGELFVVGRLKDLIIIHGQNYQPEDIEAAIENECLELGPGQCAAFSVDGRRGEELVVLVEIGRAERGQSVLDELGAKVVSAVARAFSVTISHLLLLRRGMIPKTTSNKIQRSRCRDHFLAGGFTPLWQINNDPDSPSFLKLVATQPATIKQIDRVDNSTSIRATTMRQVEAVFGNGLRHKLISSESLAQNGLDSLRAVQLKQTIENEFGIAVLVSELFETPSIDHLADLISARLLTKDALVPAARPPRASQPPLDGPASYGQQALLFEYEKDPSSATYNISVAVHLIGDLDRDRLAWTASCLMNRHTQLAAVFFRENGNARQRIALRDKPPLDFIDASGSTTEELIEQVSHSANLPFDLAQSAFRLRVFAVDARTNILLLAAHHIVIDLASLELLLREMVNLYAEGKGFGEDRTSSPTATFADYVTWEAEYVKSRKAEQSLEFWRETLANCPPSTVLPFSKSLSRATNGTKGGAHYFTFSTDLTSAIQQCATREGVTPATVMLAAYAILLAQAASETNVVVGTSVSGRPEERFSDVLGYFANIMRLPLAWDAGASFQSILNSVKHLLRHALDHQHYPFSLLAKEFTAEQSQHRNPLVRYAFTYGRAQYPDSLPGWLSGDSSSQVAMGSLMATGFPVRHQMAAFELTLMVLERNGFLDASFSYAGHLFDANAISCLAETLQSLVSRLLESPSQPIAHLEIARSRQSGQPSTFDQPCPSVLARFQEKVATLPDAIALVHGERQLSYSELDKRVAKLGHYLRQKGVGPETVVAIHCSRGIGLVLSILAVVKAGAIYLPIEINGPAKRLRFLIRDSGASVVLTEAIFADRFDPANTTLVLLDNDWMAIDSTPARGPVPEVDQDSAAYIIYTSGSTGKPKGVGISHLNLARLFDSTKKFFDIGANDTWTLFHSISFDFSVWEMWGALSSGGKLVILDHATVREPERVFRHLVEEQVSVLNLTPSAFYNLLPFIIQQDRSPQITLRYVVLGGEALKCTHLQDWFDHPYSSQTSLVNMYGITETTVHTTWLEVKPHHVSESLGSPIGQPLPDVEMYTVNSAQHLLPPYALGEIAVGGRGLARGYWHDPMLTARRFIPNPFSIIPGSRLYLSGDVAYHHSLGGFVYTGRADNQIKVRGHRIEPGEIEAALRTCPGVKWVLVTITVETDGVEGTLTAYLVCGNDLTVVILREHLARLVPEYMTPARFIRIPAVLINENGKVDLAQLRSCNESLPSGEVYAAPRNQLETTVAQIWSEVLSAERVGIDDNYFVLGGDSIRSIQIVARTRSLGIPLDVSHLLTRQTIRRIFDDGLTASQPDPRAVSEPFALVSDQDRCHLAEHLEDAFPISPMLQGLLFHSQFSDDYQVYVTSMRISGPWRPDVLETALRKVVARHPFLCSSFDTITFSEPLQLVHAAVDVSLSVQDISQQGPIAQEDYIRDLIDVEKEKKFDWSKAPLLRFSALRRSQDSFQIVLSEPYLDGWCVALLLRELVHTYDALVRGQAVPYLGKPTIGQRQMVELELKTVADEGARSFWLQYLEDCPQSLVARVNFKPAPVQVLHRRATFTIDETVFSSLNTLATHAGVPLRTVLLSVHGYVLSRLLDQDEVVFGTIANGRPEEHDGELAIGSFLNTVSMRLAIDPSKSWIDCIQRVFASECAILPYRRFPFPELKKLLGSKLDFDTIFNFTHFHTLDPLVQPGSCRIVEMDASEQTFFPLTVHFNRSVLNPRLELLLDYDCREFSSEQIDRVGEGYLQVLRALADSSYTNGTLRSFDSVFDQCVFSGPPAPCLTTSSVSPVCSVSSAINRVALASPDAVALVADDEHISYGQMQASADFLTAYLQREHRIGPGDTVGLYVTHSFCAIVSILATLQTGAAYVPIDEEWPTERKAFVVTDCAPKCILTEDGLKSRLAGVHVPLISTENFLRPSDVALNADGHYAPHETDAAYIIYTSGSTGNPKGISVEHRALGNFAASTIKEYGITTADRILQFCSFASDISIEEIFMSLCAGATLVPRPRDLLASYDTFHEFCRRQAITFLDLPTAFWADWAAETIAASGPLDLPVRLVIIGGEQMRHDLASKWLNQVGPTISLVNTYGPTETTVTTTKYWVSTTQDHSPNNALYGSPIGSVFGNASVCIADTLGRSVPPQVNGELYIGGLGVAHGYHNRPALTAERFVPDPSAPGMRRFRTSDLAFYAADDNLHFVGRLDLQIKIAGFRVELEEIESVLMQCPEIRQAAVCSERSESGSNILIGYVVLTDVARRDLVNSEQRIRRQLLEKFPRYMMPASLVFTDNLPITVSGKIDRTRLPQLARPKAIETVDPDQSRSKTALFSIVSGIWKDCLRVGEVLPGDNFFALGGDSLIAMRVASRLRATLRCDTSVRDIFENPQIEVLTHLLSAQMATSLEEAAVASLEGNESPLSFAQERLWIAEQLSTDSPSYNIPAVIAIQGNFNSRAFEQSVAEIQRRHSILSTRILWSDGSLAPSYDGLPIIVTRVDLSRLTEEHREAVIGGYRSEYVKARFDLEHDSPLRIALFTTGVDQYELVIAIHHIAADGWSINVLIGELLALYSRYSRGQPSLLDDLPIQYADFARRQKAYLRGTRRRELLGYWVEALAGLPEETPLPIDHVRPARNHFRGQRHYFTIECSLAATIAKFSRSEGVTTFMTLLTAYKVLLQSYSAQNDIVVGTPVSNRDWPETETLIGLFVNQLVIRTDMSGPLSYREALRRVRNSLISSYDHRDLPFEELVHALHPHRSATTVPLVHTIFAYSDRPWQELKMDGLDLELREIHNEAVKYDIEVQITETFDQSMRGYFEFNPQLFEEETIRKFASRYLELLCALVENPDRMVTAQPPIAIAKPGLQVSEVVPQKVTLSY